MCLGVPLFTCVSIKRTGIISSFSLLLQLFSTGNFLCRSQCHLIGITPYSLGSQSVMLIINAPRDEFNEPDKLSCENCSVDADCHIVWPKRILKRLIHASKCRHMQCRCFDFKCINRLLCVAVKVNNWN